MDNGSGDLKEVRKGQGMQTAPRNQKTPEMILACSLQKDRGSAEPFQTPEPEDDTCEMFLSC